MGEALTIEVRQERGYPIVTIAGEIDIGTATRHPCMLGVGKDPQGRAASSLITSAPGPTAGTTGNGRGRWRGAIVDSSVSAASAPPGGCVS